LDNDAANFGVPAYLQRNNKSGNDKPQSSINIPRLPDSTVDTVPQLDNDAANFGVPVYLQRNNKSSYPSDSISDTKQPLIIKNQIILDGQVIAEAVNNINGVQANRGPIGNY
jgi:hypothetical protein